MNMLRECLKRAEVIMTVSDYIQLGLDENKAYIYHPTRENEYKFLETQDISTISVKRGRAFT